MNDNVEARALKSTLLSTTGLATGGGKLDANRTIDVPIATQSEAVAGTSWTKAMTPQRTKQAIDAAIENLINGSPGALDTLNELAAALGDDANFAATVSAQLAAKVDTSRTISATGLANGGGNLSANRTIDVPIASQSEAVAGTSWTKAMTPQRTKQAIDAAIENLINGSPGALDTLNELAAALGDDANFAATVSAQLAAKVDTSRTISATGLANGGGNLWANRTIDVPAATPSEAEAGTSSSKAMTPLATRQALAAFGIGGIGAPIPGKDANNISENGIYYADSVAVNLPSFGANFALIHMARHSALTAQLAICLNPGSVGGRSAKRIKLNDTTWGPWSDDFTSVNVASQAEAEAGTSNTVPMTPLRVKQAIDAQTAGYQGTALNNVTYPIGTVLMAVGAQPDRNSSVVLRLDADNSQFSASGSGTVITGTWRARGAAYVGSGTCLYERIG